MPSDWLKRLFPVAALATVPLIVAIAMWTTDDGRGVVVTPLAVPPIEDLAGVDERLDLVVEPAVLRVPSSPSDTSDPIAALTIEPPVEPEPTFRVTRTVRGKASFYGLPTTSIFEGQPVACECDLFYSDEPHVASPYYPASWFPNLDPIPNFPERSPVNVLPFGTRLRVCSDLGCVVAVVDDGCPGCSHDPLWIDLSPFLWDQLGDDPFVGIVPVTIEILITDEDDT